MTESQVGWAPLPGPTRTLPETSDERDFQTRVILKPASEANEAK
jgi:hypothetical protein